MNEKSAQNAAKRDEKRQKFMQEYYDKKKKTTRRIITGTILVLVMVIGAGWYISKTPYISKSGGTYFVQEVPSYTGRKTKMTKITPEQKDGVLKIPLAAVEQNSIVQFDYNSGDPNHVFYGKIKGTMPLLAYISSEGRVVLASSICEPCYGTKFYLEDQSLVCVTCGTRWRNTNLSGEGGGCVDYPPEELKYTMEGDSLVLNLALLNKWQPRFFDESGAQM